MYLDDLFVIATKPRKKFTRPKFYYNHVWSVCFSFLSTTNIFELKQFPMDEVIKSINIKPWSLNDNFKVTPALAYISPVGLGISDSLP